MIQMELNIIIKFLSHLFVALRSQIAQIDHGKTLIWFKIVCSFLSVTDAIFIFYPLSGTPNGEVIYTENEDCSPNVHASIFPCN